MGLVTSWVKPRVMGGVHFGAAFTTFSQAARKTHALENFCVVSSAVFTMVMAATFLTTSKNGLDRSLTPTNFGHQVKF